MTKPYEPNMGNADLADARDEIVALATSDAMMLAASYLRAQALSLAVDINRPEFDPMGTADASREVVRMRTLADKLERMART